MENNTLGRPTELTPEILIKAQEYIDNAEDKMVKRVKSGNDGKETFETKLKVNIPTIEGLALYLNVARKTLYNWENQSENDVFLHIMERLREKQANALISNGLSGDYNPTIAKVLLTKHGYREGVEQTGKDGKDLIPEPIPKEKQDELLALLNDKTGTS